VQLKEIGPNGLQRILKDVGQDCCEKILEPDALLRGFALCLVWYKDAQKYHTNKYTTEQIRRLGLVIQASKRLEQLLVQGAEREDFGSPSVIDNCLGSVRLARKDSSLQLTRIFSKGPGRSYRANYQKRSAFEWLVAHFLPLIYINGGFLQIEDEKTFLGKDSPYLRFSMAAVKEFGIISNGKPYARSSYVKALTDAFSDTIRRDSEQASAADTWARWRLRLMMAALFPREYPAG
jgi:hypothetical protein